MTDNNSIRRPDRHQPHCKKAFTLIELLVVISIISMLISILLPALASARASAQSIQCAVNTRQIYLGFRSYIDDDRHYFPGTRVSSSNTFWSEHIGEKYLNLGPSNRWNYTLSLRPPSVFACPSSANLMSAGVRGDYGYSWNIGGDSDTAPNKGPLREDDIINPSGIILLADGISRNISTFAVAPSGYQAIMNMEGRHKKGLSPTDPRNIVNILYVDSHVEKTTIESLPLGAPSPWMVFLFGKKNSAPWYPRYGS